MYWREIFWLILWPVSIYITYRVVLWAIWFFERQHPDLFTEKQDQKPS